MDREVELRISFNIFFRLVDKLPENIEQTKERKGFNKINAWSFL